MIGDMMETKKNKVVEMIERHTKFTFLNSYNAIDQLEKNSVNCD